MDSKQQAAILKENEDYLLGRTILPAWAYEKRQYPYIYPISGSVTINVPKTLSIQINADAHFLVEGIEIIPTSQSAAFQDVLVQIFDSSHSEPWSNGNIPLRDIAGKGDSPKYLIDPTLVMPSSTINIIISSAMSTQTFYVALHGRKIYGLSDLEASLLMKRMWYQYRMVLPTMTNGQVDMVSQLQIFNQSDFLIKKLYSTQIIQFVLNLATAGTESAEIMMQLRDDATDQNFFANKLAARLVVGSQFSPYASGGASFTNAEGFSLRKPIFIRRNGTVTGTFDNRATTTATNLILTFEGCRMFS